MKFKDAELIGVPTIVVVGKGFVDGVVEVKDRATGERTDVALADLVGPPPRLTGGLREAGERGRLTTPARARPGPRGAALPSRTPGSSPVLSPMRVRHRRRDAAFDVLRLPPVRGPWCAASRATSYDSAGRGTGSMRISCRRSSNRSRTYAVLVVRGAGPVGEILEAARPMTG